MTEKLLLELILALLVGICSILWWMFTRHDRLHTDLDGKLDELSKMRVSCGSAFATKESLTRAHGRIDEQQAEISELSTRVARLEVTRVAPLEVCDRSKS